MRHVCFALALAVGAILAAPAHAANECPEKSSAQALCSDPEAGPYQDPGG